LFYLAFTGELKIPADMKNLRAFFGRVRASGYLLIYAIWARTGDRNRKALSRVQLRNIDRLILVWMYRLFPSILNAITVVKPEIVIRWHRRGFQAYWRWKSWPFQNPARDPRSHPPDERREPIVGSAADP
jgi:hypothetical protein